MAKLAREKVLTAAYRLAREGGLHSLSRSRIARRARVSAGSVSYAYGSMGALVDQVVLAAMMDGSRGQKIVAEALLEGHPRVRGLSLDERRAVFASVGDA